MHKKLIRIMIAIAISILLVGGGVALASSVLWSGAVSITIEEAVKGNPTPDPELQIVGISATQGVVVNGVWTVTLNPGQSASLNLQIENPRTYTVEIEGMIDGKVPTDPILIMTGVTIWCPSSVTISAGDTKSIWFFIDAGTEAKPGASTSVSLEVREG